MAPARNEKDEGVSLEEVEVEEMPEPIPQYPRPPKNLPPARKQVKPGDVNKTETVQTGKEYNIWYNKWAGGDREDSYSNKTKSQTRCSIKRDSGITRANTTGRRYLCLFFARGCCPYGWECEYRHTLPGPEEVFPDSSKDCFAREKFADYRDDMGGVGSFNRMNRTLYVGRIKESATGAETEEVVVRHFREWGTIERVRVLQYRSVAFVTYVSEFNAQFAKESMACQSLDNDEILNVRWATEDPNPTQKVAEKRRLEDMGREAIQGRMDPRMVSAVAAVRALEEGVVLDEEGDEYMHDGEDGEEEGRETKKRRLEIEPAPNVPAPAPKAGLLSADTLESLKYFAEIRTKVGGTTAPGSGGAKKGALEALDYGSDDE